MTAMSGKAKIRGAKPFPKGRQVEPEAASEVRNTIGAGPLRRDMLIEYLHALQDRYGCLSHGHLAALAHEMKLAMAEVFEVATFYAHFDVVADADGHPGLTVRVCDSLSCALADSDNLLKTLKQYAGNGVRVVRAPCMGRCEQAPVAAVGHNHLGGATVETVTAAVEAGATEEPAPGIIGLDAYQADGGYAKLRACLDGSLAVDAVLDALDQSDLRGLGGAGFPTGRKWRFVRQEPGPRLMAVNGDEGEPGTFKDRHYLETDPHRFIEGTLIGAWAVEADEVYIYIRDEYPAIRHMLARELDAARAAGLVIPAVYIRRGAGAYICGEESAMLESIEGKRGLPRHKPPFPSQVGLFGRPTLINNIETLYWVPTILDNGADWFAGQGRRGRKGLHSFSVSGRVKEPGVKLAPAGITVQELIDEHCGGMADGHAFKGYLPGGASGGILPASMADLPLDFGTLEEHGCLLGSAAIVVLSDQDDAKAVARNLMHFFADESCGQCTPCRVGTEKALALMDAPAWDTDLLEELSAVMADASICGLGQAAANPLLSAIKRFPEDVQ